MSAPRLQTDKQATNLPHFAGQEFHDKCMGHSNKNGHYCDCGGNGGLWVCDDCEESKVCECFKEKPFAMNLIDDAVVDQPSQLNLF